jgi:hypothetical protein
MDLPFRTNKNTISLRHAPRAAAVRVKLAERPEQYQRRSSKSLRFTSSSSLAPDETRAARFWYGNSLECVQERTRAADEQCEE